MLPLEPDMSKVCYVFLGLKLDDSAVELRRLLRSEACLYPHFTLYGCGKATEYLKPCPLVG